MTKVDITYPGDTITRSFTALVRQPVSPTTAQPIDIGLVEISTPYKPIPGPPGPPGPGVIVSDTPPADPYDGMLWWESDTGVLWAWYEDPDSAQWVQISGGTSSKSSVIIADTAPSGAENGQLWWSSSNGNLYCWYNDGDSAQWVQVNTNASGGLVTPYGAVGNGTTDDSGAWQAAIAANRNIHAASGQSYAVKDLVLSNSQSIIGHDGVFNAYAGAVNMVTLTNYGARLADAYISDSRPASGAVIKVGTSTVCKIEGVTLVNTGVGAIQFAPTSGTSAARGIVSDLYASGVTSYGISMGSSTSDWRFSNFFIAGLTTDQGGGKRKPTIGMVGWRQNTPVVSALGVGGHQLTNGTFIGCDTGMWMTDAQLTLASNVAIDSCSGYGLRIDGASDKNDFKDLFVGVTAGIYVGGTSTDNFIDGLRTIFTGTIPSWGSPDFYEVAGPYFDLQVRGTASMMVRNWKGEKRIAVDSTAKLVVMDGQNYEGKSVGNVAVATTTYLGPQGNSATELDVFWRAPYDCYVIRLMATATASPSAGQTFTYTARVNFVDSALVAVIADTSGGGVDTWAGTLIPVARGTAISIKLVTSAAATLGRHSCVLQIAPR